MDHLRDIYYYPLLIITAVAVAGIGSKVYAALTNDTIPLMLVFIAMIELVELGHFCALGTIVDIFVRTSSTSCFLMCYLRTV